jgi:membrane fusion protein, multidrug efflux system
VVEATVDNADHKLRPGMFATAKLELGRFRAPIVPLAAIREQGSLRRVFVVRDKRIEERIVQTGEPMGDKVAVISGLKSGEQVVATIAGDIKDGSRVE